MYVPVNLMKADINLRRLLRFSEYPEETNYASITKTSQLTPYRHVMAADLYWIETDVLLKKYSVL